jgi:hypothetical protein
MMLGRVVETTGNLSVIELEPQACHGCRQCRPNPRSVELPIEREGIVRLSIDPQKQLLLITHSLLLPLVGFVLGSVCGSLLVHGDSAAMVGGVLGFLVGVLCCSTQDMSLVNCDEVVEHV